MHLRDLAPALAAGLALACVPEDPGPGGSDSSGGPPVDAPIAAPPVLGPPCDGEVRDPTRIAITTTDFSTGALSILDARTGELTPDVALATSDSVPIYRAGRLHLLHRYTFDALDLLADDFRLLGQVGLGVPGVQSSNPHALARADDLAYVTLYGAPRLEIVDLADPSAPRTAGHVDLRPLADADGNPEADLAIRCGDTLFISVQRLDSEMLLSPTGAHDHLAPIDLTTGRLHDLDPDSDGVQSMPLLGPWAKQWRLDPADPTGHTVLVLSTGLERVNLAQRTATWAVDPARLAALGLDRRELSQAFDLDRAGTTAYIASYTADLTQVVLLRASLDDDAPIVQFAADLQSVGQTLEIVDNTLWFGDRSPTDPGMRAWDLRTDPPTPRFAGKPISTGLAPYAAMAIP